jgi:hypothetical protein
MRLPYTRRFNSRAAAKNLLDQVWLLGPQQHRRLLDLERLLGQALGDHLPHPCRVRRRRAEQPLDVGIVDEIGRRLA